MARGPLDGVRVIELATFVAGPFAGMTLAQMGAEVIRVDAIGGGPDVDRWPLTSNGASLYWTGLNRGKRSVTVDLRSQEGRRLVHELLGPSGERGSGVLVTNAHGRDWLEYESLRGVRSDLIQIHVRGTADGHAAVDYTINPEIGLPFATGHDPRNHPTNHVLPAWDLLTGAHAALAAVTAIRHRDQTGEGQCIEVSLEDMAFAVTASLGLLTEPVVLGSERDPSGNFLYGAFGVDFETADDRRLMVVALTSRQWRDLVDATETRELMDLLAENLGEDFERDGARYERRELLRSVLEPWFRQRTLAEVTETLAKTAVLTGEYRTFAEAAARGRAIGSLVDVDQPGIGLVPVGRHPLRFSTLAARDTVAAPTMGADTEAVFTDVLGHDPEKIAQWRAAGVVG